MTPDSFVWKVKHGSQLMLLHIFKYFNVHKIIKMKITLSYACFLYINLLKQLSPLALNFMHVLIVYKDVR